MFLLGVKKEISLHSQDPWAPSLTHSQPQPFSPFRPEDSSLSLRFLHGWSQPPLPPSGSALTTPHPWDFDQRGHALGMGSPNISVAASWPPKARVL